MENPQAKRCQAKNRQGLPCQAFHLKGSKYCAAHDPANRETMNLARKQGGAATMAKLAPKFLEKSDFKGEAVSNVCHLLVETINQARTGEIDLKVATAVGYLSNILLRAMETSDLEERIQKLEALQARIHQ